MINRFENRFENITTAQNYPFEFDQKKYRDNMEYKAINKAIDFIPKGDTVLDFPCGTGRLSKIILNRKFGLIAADASEEMVKMAKLNLKDISNINFKVEDICKTSFDDKSVDSLVCHRLFHHFNDEKERLLALSEINRVTKNIAVISIFNSFSLSSVKRSIKNKISGKKPDDRNPILLSKFIKEIESKGMNVVSKIPVRYGVSPLWLVVVNCS